MNYGIVKAPVKKRVRVGRGVGSGKGKTCGRGQKGQKSRSGVAIKGFEGGQMPLHRRLPKRGFNKPNRLEYAELTLGRLQAALDAKKLDASKPLDEDALVAAGVVRRKKDGVRLLVKGSLTSKISLTITGASKAAQEAFKKAGGTLVLLKKPVEHADKKAQD